MKRHLPTISLAVLGLVSVLFVLYQSGNNGLNSIFGKPPFLEGAFPFNLDRNSLTSFSVTPAGGKKTTYTLEGSEWKSATGRADFRKVERLLKLIQTTTVLTEIEKPKNAQNHLIELEDYSLTLHQNLPRYTGLEPLVPTFAITLSDDRTYACSSDLAEALPNLSPKSLQDHRPFFFHPSHLGEITCQSGPTTITVKRDSYNTPWRILAPLDLRADQAAVQQFITLLYTLEADEIASQESANTLKNAITIKSLDPRIPEQVLHFSDAPFSQGFNQGLAYNFSQKQLTRRIPQLDHIRAKTLAALKVVEIDSLILQSKQQSAPVTIALKTDSFGAPRWKYRTSNSWELASEDAMAELITALTVTPVSGFTLETLPPDQEPDKSVTVLLKNGEQKVLNITRVNEKILIQQGTQTAIISPSHYQALHTTPYEWKDTKLWNFSSINLRAFLRTIATRPTESYGYSYNLEEWKGNIGERDISSEIDLVAANSYLTFLESLAVTRWIPPTHRTLSEIKTGPIIELVTISQKFNELGDSLGTEQQSLHLFRHPSIKSLFVLRLDRENNPKQYALIDIKVAKRLATRLVFED